MKTKTIISIIALCAFIVSCTNKQQQFLLETNLNEKLSVIGESNTVTNIKISSMQIAKGHASLKEHGLQLTLQMSQLAKNQEYLNFCSYSKDVNKIVTDISKCKYDIPKKVFSVGHLQASLKMSSNSNPVIIERQTMSLPSQLNASSGSASLAAASLLASEDAFFNEMNLKEPVIYLYLYESGWQSMVIFRPIRDGIVLANSYFVHHNMLNEIRNSDDVKLFFNKILRLDKVYVQEYK